MAEGIDIFLEQLTFNGLEHFNKYYGNYRAIVTDNLDPEKRGRIQLYSPELGQTKALNVWVDPAFDYACGRSQDDNGNDRPKHGVFWPPEIGDFVRVAYSRGDPSTPTVYFGGWYTKGGLSDKLGHDDGGDSKTGTAPIKRGMVTKAGHALVFNDKDGKESITLSWKDDSASFTIDENATITIVTGNSHVLIDKQNKKVEILDENSNKIVLDSNGVTVTTSKDVKITADGGATIKGSSVTLDSSSVMLGSSASEPAVLGQSLNIWLTSHTHGSAMGPTSPPIVTPPPTILSQKVKVA